MGKRFFWLIFGLLILVSHFSLPSRAFALCSQETFNSTINHPNFKYIVLGTVVGNPSTQNLFYAGHNVGKQVHTLRVTFVSRIRSGVARPAVGSQIPFWKPGNSTYDFSIDYPWNPSAGSFIAIIVGDTDQGWNCGNAVLTDVQLQGSCYRSTGGSNPILPPGTNLGGPSCISTGL